MISQYVVPGKNTDGNPTWFHSILKEHLPQDAPEEVLREHLFLREQNEQAIDKWIFQPSQGVALNMEVTRLCNLRCSHCFVLERLAPKDEAEFDFDDFSSFLLNLKDRGHKSFRFLLSGGEVILKPDRCRQIVLRSKEVLGPDVATHFNINTNGVHEPTEETLAIFDLFDEIAISVDGTKNLHNAQRKPYDIGVTDVYEATLSFIRALIGRGFAEHLHVKAAMKDDLFTLENKKAFMKDMMLAGVPIGNIVFGRQYPTLHSMNQSGGFEKLLKCKGTASLDLCCRFRFMRNFFIGSGGEIYSGNFFPSDSSNILGHLGDPIEQIESRYREVILSCPALNDPKCLDCPALGVCWGGCFWGDPLTGDHPSDWCNQELMVERLREFAVKNSS